jgi:GMP synthase-like glutamine amidotransferase
VKLVEFTKEVLAQSRVRIVGVCFGHQIVARALGVEVGRNADGWEAAVNDIQLTAKGKEVFGVEKLSLHQMHRDVVYAYPEGVEELGSSPVCKVQGMYRQKRLITVQGHPEFNEEIMREILETRHTIGVFDDVAYGKYIGKVSREHDGLVVSRAFLRFMIEE